MAETIEQKLIKKITSHKKTNSKKSVVGSRISQIRGNNAGLTWPAAAHVYADSHGFSLMRYLTKEDRESLQFLKPKTPKITSIGSTPKTKKIKSTKKISPSFCVDYIDAANKNSSVYPFVYLIENALRNTIMIKFERTKDWWDDPKIVHPDIKKYAINIQQAESKYKWMPKRGIHQIFYVGIHELFKIIEKNWPIFKPIFDNLETLRTWIKEIMPIRHLIAHNVETRKLDLANIEIKASYICTMIDTAKQDGKL